MMGERRPVYERFGGALWGRVPDLETLKSGRRFESDALAASHRKGGKEPALYKLSELKEEALNPKIGRRMIVGVNEMLGYLRIKKGGAVPAHHHVSEQITYVIKGALRFTIDGKDIVVRSGEVLVIPPNVEHAVVALEDTVDLDSFSPLREDWLSGNDDYLRRQGK